MRSIRPASNFAPSNIIRMACARAADSVTLLAVSKTFPADDVRAAHAAGQMAFGENYIQEGVEKIVALADLPALTTAPLLTAPP